MGPVPEVPEEEVADLAVGQGPGQQELGQLAVQVGLVLEHLHQLQQVPEELVVPADRGGRPHLSRPRARFGPPRAGLHRLGWGGPNRPPEEKGALGRGGGERTSTSAET